MAKLLPQSLQVFLGDRPDVTVVASGAVVSVDGERIGPALVFSSLDECEAWATVLAEAVSQRKAQLRLALGDEASDAVCEGRSVA